MPVEQWFNNLPINQYLIKESSRLYDKLIYVATTIQPLLDAPDWYIEIAYTPHNFSNHIRNVLTNASSFFSSDTLKQFTCEEVFCFQCACILHDIDMVYNPRGRKSHSYNGAQIVSNLLNSKSLAFDMDAQSNLYRYLAANASSLTTVDTQRLLDDINKAMSSLIKFLIPDKNMRKAISWIILGHSDIKSDENGNIQTLLLDEYNDARNIVLNKNGNKSAMKLRVLAAFLRWADELDCSSDRIADIDEGKMINIPSASKEHWDKLQLISQIKTQPDNMEIYIDEDIFFTDENRYCRLLEEVLSKLKKEQVVIKETFDREMFSFYIPDPEKITLLPRGKAITAFENYQKKGKSKSLFSKNKIPPVDIENIDEPKTLDIESLNEEIREYIITNDLIREGHYIIHNGTETKDHDTRTNERVCIRNSFDCGGLLAKHQLLDKITQAMCNFYYTDSFATYPDSSTQKMEKHLLIGITNSGAILAAHMAVVLNQPFSYFVPSNKKQQHTSPEIDITFHDDNLKIILIVGVNHTGKTIYDAFKYIKEKADESKIKVEITKIIGFLNRESTNNYSDNQQIADNSKILDRIKISHPLASVGFLMTDFEIEECPYSKSPNCSYKKKCINTSYSL